MSVGGSWTPSPSILFGTATHAFNPILGGLADPGHGKKIDTVVETLNPHQVSILYILYTANTGRYSG